MLGTPLGRILLAKPTWTYLLGPFFKSSTPNAAAPLPATYREAGAVGALTTVDTTAKISVSGAQAVFAAGSVSAWTNPALNSAVTFARVAGRTLLATLDNTNDLLGPVLVWSTALGNFTEAVYRNGAGGLAVNEPGYMDLTVVNPVTDPVTVAIVLRGTGAFFCQSVSGVWRLLYISNGVSSTPLYARVSLSTASGAVSNLRVADLGGAWASDYGIATGRKATSANGDTITHTANCLVEHTITAATGVTQELWVRRTDASNGWIVRMSQAGSTIKLIELVAGGETERASSAQTWTNGTQYRVVVICDGTTITPYVANVAKTGYASATTNQTATQCYVSHAGADLVAWPRMISLPSGV